MQARKKSDNNSDSENISSDNEKEDKSDSLKEGQDDSDNSEQEENMKLKGILFVARYFFGVSQTDI